MADMMVGDDGGVALDGAKPHSVFPSLDGPAPETVLDGPLSQSLGGREDVSAQPYIK